MSDCTLDFILPTSQLYKTSSWALRHHLFSSFFSFFCCTDGNHLLQRRPWTNLFCCRFLYSGLWMVGHILTWCWTGSGFCVVHKIFTHRGIHKAVRFHPRTYITHSVSFFTDYLSAFGFSLKVWGSLMMILWLCSNSNFDGILKVTCYPLTLIQ